MQAIAPYKNRNPTSIDEEEYLENLFNSLCACLMSAETRNLFLKAEGKPLGSDKDNHGMKITMSSLPCCKIWMSIPNLLPHRKLKSDKSGCLGQIGCCDSDITEIQLRKC